MRRVIVCDDSAAEIYIQISRAKLAAKGQRRKRSFIAHNAWPLREEVGHRTQMSFRSMIWCNTAIRQMWTNLYPAQRSHMGRKVHRRTNINA